MPKNQRVSGNNVIQTKGDGNQVTKDYVQRFFNDYNGVDNPQRPQQKDLDPHLNPANKLNYETYSFDEVIKITGWLIRLPSDIVIDPSHVKVITCVSTIDLEVPDGVMLDIMPSVPDLYRVRAAPVLASVKPIVAQVELWNYGAYSIKMSKGTPVTTISMIPICIETEQRCAEQVGGRAEPMSS
ncbi:BZ3500_MvSof-1268-A1-R1_Chr12-2g03714 [Microbotryum saponariae]|uniref:BZ3500_MvSof-1268-A1-R1_Chr12-2g03714 protein n=1 Tax=Microbotryum saponariae TaxID=289078 RepID=A0A2X0KKC9_9BASI|nr:BZ3500_MvSof-1268-A1-R1_Chr12-2g03714 [Microbotryum saponariae]SDA05302.1 BZ3501_MvSof-1269-A2-R1_Chr12-1g03286 [Microbotryum saponariae]